MRFRFFAWAGILLLVTTPNYAQTIDDNEYCFIISSSGLCIVTQLQYAECGVVAACGPLCPSPPLPGQVYWKTGVDRGINYCPELAVVNVTSGTAIYDMFMLSSVEGRYTEQLFRKSVRYEYCAGQVVEYGEVNPCSTCRTYNNSGSCYQSGNQVPMNCTTIADCVVGPCVFPRVAAGITINHNCPNPSAITCAVGSNADVLGAFASGFCTYQGFVILEGYSYWDCDGSSDSVGQVRPCP